jgi:histidine triad (HIT) family protein
MKYLILLLNLIAFSLSSGQSAQYTTKKNAKLAVKSPFEKIVDRELPATIEYEDEEIIAFIPLRKQTPVHILICPKKRIPTINDMTEEDELLIGSLFTVAKKLAKEKGVAETGYRLAFNNNEHSGQSVFHLHLHLLGGMFTGPMCDQTYKDERNPERKEED